MTTPKAFIFDLDGTLIDALPDIQANANRALQELGYERQLSLAETQPHVGGGAQKLAASVLNKPLDDDATMAMYHAFTKFYEAHPADFGKPFPGVMQVLNTLRERDIPISVVTAKPARARIRVLDAMELTSYFTLALSPEDGYAKKPAPDMLLQCCKAMGVKPEESVMVGDTRFDVEAGFNAKCGHVAFAEHGYQDVPNEFAHRVVRLHDFTDVLKLLDD